MNNHLIFRIQVFFTRIRSFFIQWKPALIAGITGFLGLRLWSSAVLLLLNFFPPQVIPSDLGVQNQLMLLESSGTLSKLFLAPWYRWDTVYYLEIAKDGYSRAFLTVWPPLYSGLIRLVSFLGITPLLSAVVVSNLCAIIALALLFRMGEEENPGQGRQIIKGLVFFPTAFFLVAAYSESLYLCFTIGALWMAHKNRLGWAALWAALATLTRLQGVVLVIPLLFEGYRQNKHKLRLPDKTWNFRQILETGFFSAFPVLIAGGYALYIRFSVQAPWPWETLGSAWGQHTGWPWEGVIGNLTSIIGIRHLSTPINPLAQVTDLILVLLAIIFLIWICRQKNVIPVSYQIYAWIGLAMILIKVDNQGLLVSASRYLLSLFPIFLALAAWIKGSRERFFNVMILVIGLVTQAVLLICFSWWVWVA